MPKEEPKPRKRMVVEEVKGEASDTSIASGTEPATEIKEKVEELHNITEDIGQSVEKSEEVQEEIAKAAEKVAGPSDNVLNELVPVRPNSGPSPLFILIPGVLLLGALLGGVYFYQKSVNQNLQPTPTPGAAIESSVSATVVPSASPSAKLDLTKYAINVQNGSGIPGTAGVGKALLTKAGFKVGTTGNADNYDYTDTIIKTKADVPPDFNTKLTTTLSGIYSVAKVQSLPASSSAEVVVIIGSSKAK